MQEIKHAEYMDRNDKILLRKADKLISEGSAKVQEGYRLRRALYQRLFMRAKRDQ